MGLRKSPKVPRIQPGLLLTRRSIAGGKQASACEAVVPTKCSYVQGLSGEIEAWSTKPRLSPKRPGGKPNDEALAFPRRHVHFTMHRRCASWLFRAIVQSPLAVCGPVSAGAPICEDAGWMDGPLSPTADHSTTRGPTSSQHPSKTMPRTPSSAFLFSRKALVRP